VGGAGSDWGSSIIATDPGQYVIAGHTECSGAGGYDGWLLRMREPEAGVPEGRSPEAVAVPGPNPFTATTTIRFSVPSPSPVVVAIYDFAGRRVKVLRSTWLAEGEHTAVWDGCGERGERVAPGIYLVRVTAGETSTVSKLVRLAN
jgi:hypothetical protein